MDLSAIDQVSTNRRRVRTLPSWLSASISISDTECQRDHLDDSSKVNIENSLAVTVKTEFTEFDGDLSLCPSTYIEPNIIPKVEEIPIETVFVQETEDTKFIREDETAAVVEAADSTNMNDCVHSDTNEVVSGTCDSTMKCKVKSITPIQSSPTTAAGLFIVPTSTSSSPIPTLTNTSDPSCRPICMYHHQCYRMNPQHKKDFSHPGDADYDDQSECDSTCFNSAPAKPRCWYGRNCYRKNDEHKEKFYHPPSNSRKRNAARVQNNHVNEDDGFDAYDNSFIDDDSANEFSLGSDDEETEFSDFETYSSSDDDVCQALERSKKKKFSIL